MMVESADTADLKFAARKSIRVRVSVIPGQSLMQFFAAKRMLAAEMKSHVEKIECLSRRSSVRIVAFHEVLS